MANHHNGKTTCPAETLILPKKGTLNTTKHHATLIIHSFELITYFILKIKLKTTQIEIIKYTITLFN